MPNIRCCVNCAGNKKVLSRSARRLIKGVFACWLMCTWSLVQALPEGGEVVAGEASIQVEGAVMDVQQASQRAVINYQNFNIAAQETVNFHQPNANAVVLNRVVGSNLAEIYGHINANGQVYLINPNGVLMGQGATLNVGGLVVTTLDMAQEDFLAGRDAFAGGAQGRVENQGVIQADQRVVLLAPEVINGGDIRVPDGQVVLRSARQALLQTPGSSIPLLVEQADLAGQVVNQGRIEAATVALANGANTSITNTGVVRAVRASGAGGVIELLAPSGDITNSGHLDASALEGSGGKVNLAAVHIDQTGAISASAAGDAGDGGVINLHASDALALHDASRINADAAARGNGGEIRVVAEKNAWFTDSASISAKGGNLGGDGGFVEFSGHEFVSVSGLVEVNSVTGKAGLWYIDPTDINITNTDSAGTFSGGNPHVWGFFGTPATSQINVVSIRNALTSGDVTINTASGASSVGNITFNGVLDFNGLGTVRTLNLTANGSVNFQSGSIYDVNLGTASDGLNINVTAGTGISVVDGVAISSALGKINFVTTTGDATISGLGSTADANDAIRVTASTGRILDGGSAFYEATALVGNGGVQLTARDGISVQTDTYNLNLLSSNGDLSVINRREVNISRLSASSTTYLSAGGAIHTDNSTVFGGANVQLLSSSFIAVPQNGLTVSGNLTLQGADVVDQNGSRTVSLGANHLTVNSAASGGDSIFNTAATLLSVANSSANSLSFNDTDSLTTVSVSPFTGTTTINSGAGFDLTVGSHIELDSETGTLTFNAGKDLLVNGSVTDTNGAISNTNTLNFNATNNVTFGASGAANAGAGSVSVSTSNGNVALGGNIAGATMTVSAAGAGLGNITSNTSIDLNGFGAVRTLNLNATGVISFTGGNIADSDTNTASDGLNINATAGTGFSVSDGAVLAAGAGKINITTTLGNAAVTGLSSTANAADAIRITASGGSIFDSGNSRTDISATAANGGAILSGLYGITALATDVSFLDALSSSGDITLTESNALNITRLSAADSSSITAGGAILTTNSTVFGGNDLSLISSSYIQVPQLGLSRPDLLLLQAADVRAEAGGRTVTLGGHHVSVDTDSSGGNLQINSTTDLLTLKNTGSNTITLLNDTDALLLVSVRPQSGSTIISSGVGSDLTVANAPIELNGSNGSLTLNAGADLIINQTMLDTIGAVNNATTINLNAVNNVTFTSSGLVNAGTGSVTINAAGGNVALGRVDATSTSVSAAGAITDANASVVNLNGTSATLSAGTTIGASTDSLDATLASLTLSTTNGSAYLTSSQGLSLTSANVHGDLDLSLPTAGNLTLVQSAPVISGDARFAVSAGQIIIPDAGWSTTGNLTFSATNLQDSNNDVTLAAAAANISLTNAASNRTWATSFNSLVLSLTGAGDFSLTDSNGLVLTSASTGGNASFTATNADLTLSADPSITGNLTLNATGTGNVILPTSGISESGNLIISANDLLDTDHTLTLAAANAAITLSNAASAMVWNTSFTNLILSLTGGGSFDLTDTNALTLTSASTSGNASFTTTNADLTLSSDPAVTGNLSLITTGVGNVIIPSGGITQPAALTINANDVSDGDLNVSLAATNANITLRNVAATHNWSTGFNNASLALTGAGNFNLTDSDALTITSASHGGNLAVTTTNANLTLAANTSVTGTLSLTTTGAGNVIVPAAGYTQSAGLTINANDLTDGDLNVSLAATNANISLRNAAAAHTWATTFNALDLVLTGAGDFNLTDANALALNSISTGGNASFTATNASLTLSADPSITGNLTLNATGIGNVILPTAGISESGNLTISANDLLDTDHAITLAAANANVTLNNAASAMVWNTSFANLMLSLTGGGSFDLIDTNELTLTSASTSGNASFTTTNADLTLSSDPAVTGNLSLITTGAGNVIIPSGGISQQAALTINANDLTDGDLNVTLAATNANIALRNAAAARTWATTFNTLDLVLTGAGDFNLTDANALTLNSISAGANASFTSTNANLTLSADPSIAGNLTLNATGIGNVILPTSGISESGNLTISANDLLDTDHTITLAAANANVTLSNAASAMVWNTSFTNLILSLTGGGSFDLTDTNALTLTSASTSGNASFTTTNADLTLSSDPAVTGNLILNATGAGNVIIPVGGIVQPATLSINANDLLDTDRAITLAATSANISLRNATAAHTWNTSFTDLILSLTGGGDFSLTDSNALILASASTSGNASFITTNADLTLTTDPAVSGNLSLIVTGAGNVIIPSSGIIQPAGLTINANDLSDGDANISLSATNADITLRNAAAARTWTTDFNNLNLALTGAGSFTLNDANALTLGAITAGANANFSTTNADLTLSANTTVTGILNLTTSSSGNVIVPGTGFTQSGALIINAYDLLDTDRAITLVATSATINLRNATAAHTLNSTFSDLILSLTGGGDFSLTDTSALTLTSVSTAGNASFTTINADLTLSSDPAVTGNLSLIATGAGNVIIPGSGIIQPAGLTIDANDLSDGDANVSLSAANADITLRNAAAARTWTTDFNNLNLALTGAGSFTLNDANALTLGAIAAGANANFSTANADLTLSANTAVTGTLNLTTSGTGNVIVPGTGFTQSGALTINAYDLLDTDRAITLAATSATINLRNATAAHTWNTTFADLILSLTGGGDFSLTDTNALILTSASTSGNASFTTTNADLTLATDPAVSGNLSLITTGSGNIIIPSSGIVQPAGLTINANDVSDGDANINLAAANADITLRNATASRTWAADFNNLNLALTGAGSFTLNDANALTLGAITAGANANFNTTNADLTLSANTAVTGILNLTTSGTGNVIVPGTGFTQSGALTIDAYDLLDTDTAVTLAATSANINLRNANAAHTWNTTFSDLILSLTGGGDFSLTDTNALIVTSASTSGNASFTTTNADLTLATDPAVSGNLSLITTGSGNIIIPSSGIVQPAGLTINANDLSDGDVNVSLSATNADITLRNATAPRTWAADFNNLNLAHTGAGSFTLNDANALTLGAITAGANANFSTTNADITLSANTAVTGTLNLTTSGTGTVIVPAAGFTQSGALTINANDLMDANADIILAATNADITLRAAASARTWNTGFDNLLLSLTGSGDFTLIDTNALTLTSVTSAGNASFTTTNADLTLSGDPTITGNLILNTTGAGNIIVPTTGINESGNLTINASDVFDTDHNISLAAASATINLRNAASPLVWNTAFNDLSLALLGGGDFSLIDTNALILTSASTSGNASFATTNADLTLIVDPAVTGNLSLLATGVGNVIIPSSGIVQSAALTIIANDLLDTDRDVTLNASNASITLRDATSARSWITNFSQLDLSLTGVGAFSLNNANALTLNAVTTGGNASFTSGINTDLTLAADTQVAGTLNLTANGTGNVIMPTHFIQAGALTLNSNDLLNVTTLAATDANITLRNTAINHSWNTRFDNLTLASTGLGNFDVTDTDALTLNAIATGGSAKFTTNNADLTLAADTNVAGTLNLTANGAGNVILPTQFIQAGALTLNSNDLLNVTTLAASDANITLRNTAINHSWNTSFDNLTLSSTGLGNFDVTDADALSLNAISTGGSAGFTTNNADLTLTANTNVTGTLNLTAAGSGNVLLPNNFVQTGALTLNSNDLLNVATLAATNANITLRNTAVDHTWNTRFDNLTLAATGPGNFNLTDADGLTLNAVSTGGSAAFNSTGANLILSIAPSVAGNLTLSTINSGDIILPSAPFVTAGNLTLTADTISDGDNDLNLTAASANITLRSAATRNWFTQFDDLILSLSLATTDNFNLTDANALTLNSVISGGDAGFTTGNNANLTLANNSAVAGRLSLNTTGSGAIILPAIGFSQSGALTLNAYDLMDTDRDVRLAATNANITLRNNTNARNWATQFDSLNLALNGSGDFTLTDSDALQINAASSGGNAHFSTQNADLTLSASPAVAGDLQLITTGVGKLIIPDSGINHGGDLFIDSKDLQDSDRSVNVRANHAQLNLRDTTAALMLTTRINSLDLTSPSTNAISLANASDLILGTFNSGGDSAITSVGSLDLSQAAFSLGGTLNLTASDNLLLAASGFQSLGPLNIKAANLSAQGGVPVHLSATTADIQLTGSDAINLIGDLQQLALSTESVGAVTISNNQNLFLSRLDAPNADALSFAVAGALRIPNSGLATAHSLAIDAFDLLDDDRSLSLSAPQLRVALSAASGQNLWNLNVDELDAAVSGHADLQLVDKQGLSLVDLNGDGTGLSLADGNLALLLRSGDLTINADVGAIDGSVDGTATGHIDIEVANGNLTTQGPLQITSTQQTAGAPGDFAIALRLTDTSASDHTITLNTGAKLTAIGGDILIDTRPINTQPAAKRQYIQAAGAQVAAYTNKNDATTGRATINNIPFIPSVEQKIGSGRWLAIVADAPSNSLGALDENLDVSEDLPPLPQQQPVGPSVDNQFAQAFGPCDELDPKNRNRCRVNSALKTFLSHWLVGGEMAPKVDLK